ncbi:MAG: hypothetical protein KDI27_11100 [Gammaproteobacteria bacterium]|nr:hypothetical protein [Gammaproteobacteria bacterium]MCP5417396.1 hypothetical protein [Chromatiaceae bacterium]
MRKHNSRVPWVWSISAALAALIGIGAHFVERIEFNDFQRLSAAREANLNNEITALNTSISQLRRERSVLSDTGEALHSQFECQLKTE